MLRSNGEYYNTQHNVNELNAANKFCSKLKSQLDSQTALLSSWILYVTATRYNTGDMCY